MLWIAFTLLAAIFWAVANIIDKHVMDKEIRDPFVSTFFWGLIAFLIMGVTSLLMGSVVIPLETTVYSLIAGIFYGFAVLLFYRVILSEEISRVIPIILLTPIVVLILATVFLSEIFTPLRYLGIALLVLGSILISLKHKAKYSLSPVLGLTLVSMVLFASRDFMVKVATLNAGIWPVMFWASVGWLAVSAGLFAVHHPRITKKAKIGIRHIMYNAIFATIAFIFSTMAISFGFVSLVSALRSVQSLFVFLIAVAISLLWPGMIKEEVNRSVIKLKLIAIAIIIIGSFLIL
jgi:uncharacterized membrane protein